MIPYLIGAGLVSALLMLLLMPECIRRLRALKFGQTMYKLGPQSHLSKQGTPNMGGVVMGPVSAVVMILGVLVYMAVQGDASVLSLNSGFAMLLLASLGSMAVGFTDDYIKDVKKNHEGLKPMQKIVGQLVVGIIVAVWGYFCAGPRIRIPFVHTEWDLGIWYIPLITLTVLFMTNSANLQDGLDGLLSSVTVIGMLGFAAVSLLLLRDGKVDAPAGKVCAIQALALCGACAGFLVFNHHPAKIFMGDTGSMYIGGVMIGLAVALRCEFWLLLICFTCVMSSVSVMLQVGYFKLTHGKRIFKMSPIHHHFELCGMTEKQIVAMYSAVTLLLTLVAVFAV